MCFERNTESTSEQFFFYWILALTGSQWSVLSTHMPGLTEDYTDSMILYALKFIQFVVRETSK